MAATLDHDAFAGERDTPPRSRSSFVGEARFDGYFLTVAMPRAQAAASLPQGFELAASNEAEEGCATHPALIVLGRQSETAVLFAGKRWPTGFRYLEAALLVPFVRRRGSQRLCSYLPRMYAGDRVATFTGNTTYGYNKVHTALHWMSDTFAVADPAGGVALEAKVESAGEWETCDANDPSMGGFERVRSLANLPIVGRRADGSIVTSFFEWDASAASVRGARGVVSACAGIAPGLAAAVYESTAAESFEVGNLCWRVSWPVAAGR